MSELTTGGPTELMWSNPSPVYIDGEYVTGGMVWFGYEECTKEDQQDWVDFVNSGKGSMTIDDFEWDYASFVGRYHPDWTSHHYSNTSGGDKPGGLGSFTYETQHVGAGVQFAKAPIWHYTAEGEYVKEFPADAGAYHSVDVGGGYSDNHAGPAPDSDAAAYLGDSHYYFDETDCWYEVKGKEAEVSPKHSTDEAYSFCPNCGHALG